MVVRLRPPLTSYWGFRGKWEPWSVASWLSSAEKEVPGPVRSQVRLPHVSSARFLHLPGQTGRTLQNRPPPIAGKPTWAIPEVLSPTSAAAALEAEASVGEVWPRIYRGRSSRIGQVSMWATFVRSEGTHSFQNSDGPVESLSILTCAIPTLNPWVAQKWPLGPTPPYFRQDNLWDGKP